MICLKNKLILFLLAFIATLQVGLVFRTERLIKTIEDFEPVVIQWATKEESEESEEVSEEETSLVEEETSFVEQETSVVKISPRINCSLDDETQQMILDKCEEHNIDFAFTMGVIYAESRFQADADSGSSVGLMQINRINHGWLSEKLGLTDFFDPEQNVTAGLHMLEMLFEKYEDPALVLMAYNMGETGAKRRWDKGIYTSDYAEAVLQQAEIYNQEIQERMGENDSM
jgi:hypothetical protein